MAFPVMIGVLIWIFSEKLASFMVEREGEKGGHDVPYL